MGLMAGLTVAAAVGLMGIGVAARQLLVAPQAGVYRLFLEQTGMICSMGTVTRQTVTTAHRLVDPLLVSADGGIDMAGQAQILDRLLQQPGVAGNMGAMAGQAIPLRRRLVINLLAVVAAVVALETIHRQGHGTTQQNEQSSNSGSPHCS